ncbi:hypothetical protein [Holdemania filiformis]|uniref:hypothetical protein n=1 Tax=Holdemania filiformis TaxID=61171 RepID=UPI00242F00A8|nr:hypothetical protein [Holdemania filiformis]
MEHNNKCEMNKKDAVELTRRFGSPLYVFDEDDFISNYHELLESVKSIYPKYNIAYSYKTNYAPYICKIVKNLGGYAEVVSGMEYQVARKLGYEPKNIVFNGPMKGSELYEHIDHDGVANIDNLDELDLVVSHIKANPDKNYRLAFRVNIDIEQGYVSRFGIDADNGDLEYAFRTIADIKNAEVVGIHCHVGRSRSLSAWKKRVEIMFRLIDKHFTSIPQFVDLGSGMNSIMEPALAAQFGDQIPTYLEYAEIIGKAFFNRYGDLPVDEQPELITEPGTTVISAYISFLTTVNSIRKVKGKDIITVDGSVGNTGDICDYKQLPITVNRIGECRNVKDANIVGYTCLEADILYRSYSGVVGVSDIIEFRNVGSYSNVFKPPFIYPNCAMIAISVNHEPVIFKRKETMEDVFMTYKF